jgi:hypothetical protein
LAAPQLGQVAANGVAHSMQNFAPTRFSVPQFVQITPFSSPVPIRAGAECTEACEGAETGTPHGRS